MVVLPDVNVLVYGFRSDLSHHAVAKNWLHQALNGAATFAFHPMLGAAMIRICTNPKVFANPSTVMECNAFLNVILTAPNTVQIAESATFWSTFTNLLATHNVSGPRVSDFYFAALAIDHDATLWSFDRGFSHVAEIKSGNPLKDALT